MVSMVSERGSFTNIETERLLLRKISLLDASKLFEYWSDEEVTKYMSISRFSNVNEAEEMISLLLALAASDQAFRWTIVNKLDGKILGTCGFNNWDETNQRGEIGYELGRQFWGQGIMTEALNGLIKHGFNTMKLNRIQALVEPDNCLSRKVLLKRGFSEEGLLRQYEMARGHFVDLLILSLLKKDYKEDKLKRRP